MYFHFGFREGCPQAICAFEGMTCPNSGELIGRVQIPVSLCTELGGGKGEVRPVVYAACASCRQLLPQPTDPVNVATLIEDDLTVATTK